ncbi:MAG: triphosphoribosyl-dephospho-CoA synthase [Planctomycetaceae bacterium]
MLCELVKSACRLEVLSPKPGNVCPGSEFDGASVADFLTSADIIAPILSSQEIDSPGRAIYESVRQTREVVGHNTNLGIILLLAPLCRVPMQVCLADGLPDVLNKLTVADARWTYRAIALANPGGLGSADQQDVRSEPDEDLRSCMNLAADRDFIARQYSNGFAEVLRFSRDWNHLPDEADPGISQRVCGLALTLMSEFGDSLIARKCGVELSATVQRMAADILQSGWPVTERGITRYREFDAFLRADGHRRNPGTTADMVAAILFAGFRDHLHARTAAPDADV